jgi:multicomponent Na+:H+ antiporter subunit F
MSDWRNEGFIFVLNLSIGMISIGLVISLIRMVRGPHLADRVVAVDLMAIQMVGFITLYSIAKGETLFLDVAIAVGLVAFLNTVAFGRYLERISKNQKSRE